MAYGLATRARIAEVPSGQSASAARTRRWGELSESCRLALIERALGVDERLRTAL